jgi:hypothetical protein
MPILVSYQRSDGLIRGLWSANNEAILLAQVVENDPVIGYLLVPDQDKLMLQEQYLVSASGLITKPAVTLQASPSPFPADGASVCTVSVVPFVPCTVLVDTTPYSLVSEDPTLLLTADAPTLFQVSLPHQAACWGSPLTVEAV